MTTTAEIIWCLTGSLFTLERSVHVEFFAKLNDYYYYNQEDLMYWYKCFIVCYKFCLNENFLAISILHEISGFRREVAQNCDLLGYYAASSGNFLAKFRDNLSVPSSGLHFTQVID